MQPLILASHSPRRKELIKLLDRPFELHAVEIEETVRTGEKPSAVVCALAFQKAFASQKTGPEAGCYIGSDTIVAIDNVIFGKPESREQAKEMLKALSGRTHQVFTGVALLDQAKGIKRVKAISTDVVFRELSEELIEWYLNTGEYEGKAGAYAIQGFGSRLVSGINGDFFNVVGFPLVTVDEMLTELAL